jgi:hypothetical protein
MATKKTTKKTTKKSTGNTERKAIMSLLKVLGIEHDSKISRSDAVDAITEAVTSGGFPDDFTPTKAQTAFLEKEGFEIQVQEEPKKKPKKERKKKESKSTVERDEWGSKVGSKAAAINAALKSIKDKKDRTTGAVRTILKEQGVNGHSKVCGHITRLESKGHIKINEDKTIEIL